MFKPGSRLGRNPAGTSQASLPASNAPIPVNQLPARGIQLTRPAQALIDQPGVMATFSHCVGVEGEKEPVYSYTLPDGTQLNECFVGGFCLGLCDPAGNVVAGLPN